jgi:hypothetical protein
VAMASRLIAHKRATSRAIWAEEASVPTSDLAIDQSDSPERTT